MQDKKPKKDTSENPKAVVIDRLLCQARLIRKTAKPEIAIAAAEYEQQLESDLAKLEAA